MAGCSLLFMGIYGGCNWITSLRSDVGTWFYEWEMRIPFVPAMIVPYWSIDLFFVGSFFVCRNRRELDTLGRRIALAILVAGACFLLLPLRLAFPRPQVGGVFGTLFESLRAFDHPYNLVPSLHIALRTLLADLYARHSRGPLRLAVHVWFSLVGVSTLFTYQHHVVDVAGGFVLATACFYVIREAAWTQRVTSNGRIGSCYALGCAVALALSAGTWPSGGVLLWPAAALGIVTAGYLGLGPAIFRKQEGVLPLSSRLVLGPCLLGQQLSLLYYRRKCRPWDALTPNVWMGRRLDADEAADAIRQGVTAVLDLTGEFSEARPFLRVAYRNLPILDLTVPTQEQLREAVGFMAKGAAAGGIVYVHCKIGYSRTAAAVGAYLLASGKAATADDAVAMMRAARPSLVVRPEAMAALRAFERTAGSGTGAG
jgi:protein-tyrosine phosphatase/membrane-associated phospholipid phosphatase